MITQDMAGGEDQASLTIQTHPSPPPRVTLTSRGTSRPTSPMRCSDSGRGIGPRVFNRKAPLNHPSRQVVWCHWFSGTLTVTPKS